MKKLISILISLAMVFTLFAAVPAFAAAEQTGSFNIQPMDYDNDGDLDQPYAVSQSQKVYLNFEEALDRDNLKVTLLAKYSSAKNTAGASVNDDAKYAVDLGVKSVNFDIDGDGTVDVNDSTHKIQYYLDYELSDDAQSIRIWLCKSDGTAQSWATASYGNRWHLYVKVNEAEYRLKFVTTGTPSGIKLAEYGTGSTKTNIQDGMTNVALDKSFRAYSSYKLYPEKGQLGRWIVTEKVSGETVIDELVAAANYQTFNLNPPATGWKPSTEYNVKFYYTSVWKFDELGNRTNYNVKLLGEWNFTNKEAEIVEPEEPELPEEPEITPTGKFNIPDNATAVAKETEAIYKFAEPISAANQAKITATLTYKTLADKNIVTPTGTPNGYTKLTWSNDGQYLTVTRVSKEGNTYNNPWTGGSDGYGRTNKIELAYNGEVFDDVIFTVPQEKAISTMKWSGGTNFEEGATARSRNEQIGGHKA